MMKMVSFNDGMETSEPMHQYGSMTNSEAPEGLDMSSTDRRNEFEGSTLCNN